MRWYMSTGTRQVSGPLYGVGAAVGAGVVLGPAEAGSGAEGEGGADRPPPAGAAPDGLLEAEAPESAGVVEGLELGTARGLDVEAGVTGGRVPTAPANAPGAPGHAPRRNRAWAAGGAPDEHADPEARKDKSDERGDDDDGEASASRDGVMGLRVHEPFAP